MLQSPSNAQSSNVMDPLCKRIAGTSQHIRVIIRMIPSLLVESVFTALDKIYSIRWSPDGNYILASVPTQGVVQIWSVRHTDWSCRIDAGSAGLSDALWHPIRQGNVLVYSDFNLKVDIWNMRTESRCALMNVKSHFIPVLSNCGHKAIILTRKDAKDTAHLVALDGDNQDDLCFRIYQSIVLAGTLNIVGVCWTNSDKELVAWECPLNAFVYLFSLDGTLLKKVDLFEGAQFRQLGIRTVELHGPFLAFGCHDSTIRLFTIKEGLCLLAVLDCNGDKLLITSDLPTIWRENLGGQSTVRDRNVYTLGGSNASEFPVEYREIIPEEDCVSGLGYIELPEMNVPVPLTHLTGKAAIAAGPPASGVAQLSISPDGRFIACRCDSTPSVIRIFDLTKMTLFAVLLHRQPVRDLKWNPSEIGRSSQLAVVTGDIHLFLWSAANGNRTIRMNDPFFKPTNILWTADGRYLVLSDNEKVINLTVNPKDEDC